jgi:hypothetical protein
VRAVAFGAGLVAGVFFHIHLGETLRPGEDASVAQAAERDVARDRWNGSTGQGVLAGDAVAGFALYTLVSRSGPGLGQILVAGVAALTTGKAGVPGSPLLRIGAEAGVNQG